MKQPSEVLTLEEAAAYLRLTPEAIVQRDRSRKLRKLQRRGELGDLRSAASGSGDRVRASNRTARIQGALLIVKH